MYQDLNALKGYLRVYVESVTRHSKGTLYICPICGSGTHGNGGDYDGAFSIEKNGERWKCFSCSRGGDIFDLASELEHLDRSEATKFIIKKYGGTATAAQAPAQSSEKEIAWNATIKNDWEPDAIKAAKAATASAAPTAAVANPQEIDWSKVPYESDGIPAEAIIQAAPAAQVAHDQSAPAAEPTAATAPAAHSEAPSAATTSATLKDFSGYIRRCAKALPGSPAQAYLEKRGITLETARRFGIGYDENCYNKALRQYVESVIIPYGKDSNYFVTRPLSVKKYDKPKSSEAGAEPVFNADALYNSPFVFVCESQLCAISIEQSGGAAVSIGGTGTAKLINQLKAKPTTATLIVCLDNDEPGRKETETIDKALTEIRVEHFGGTSAIMGEATDESEPDFCKDPNEVLQKMGADALATAVSETVDGIKAIKQEAERERQRRTGAAMVDSFLQDIQTHKFEPVPTGIAEIDKVIGGGFMRQQIMFLGAAPGAGKTSLSQWIFEGMAQKGHSVIYINLEMSREQLLSRSLARVIRNENPLSTINSSCILQGYRWNKNQRAAILHAIEIYKETIAARLIYNPDEMTTDIDALLNYLEDEAIRAERAHMKAPLVVLDYLQLLTGRPREDVVEALKRAVTGLKKFAIRHNTFVLAIIANNRESNRTGEASMESARDTSAIEYGADLQFALTFTACHKRPGTVGKLPKPSELTKEQRKYITLCIVKGRGGGVGDYVDLKFDGATMTYTPMQKVKESENPFDSSDAEPLRRV